PSDSALGFLRNRRSVSPPVFPYTTLFRSRGAPPRARRVREVEREDLPASGDRVHDLRRPEHRQAAVLEARCGARERQVVVGDLQDRKSTRLNSSHVKISYDVCCLKKKKLR